MNLLRPLAQILVFRRRLVQFLVGLSALFFIFAIFHDFPKQILGYFQQERQCKYNVTLRRVRVTIIALEKYYIF